MTKAEPNQLPDKPKAPKRTTQKLKMDKNKAKTRINAATKTWLSRHTASPKVWGPVTTATLPPLGAAEPLSNEKRIEAEQNQPN